MSDLRDAVLRHVPMDYLQRHDVPGATGPTEACNVSAALKDYAEDRWKLIDRLKSEKDANRALADVNHTLLEAARQVEDWWLNVGMNVFVGAPPCIFDLRAAIAKATGDAS